MSHREAVTRLIAEIDRYLARLSGSGIAEVRDGIARSKKCPAETAAKPAPPLCGHLDAALRAMTGADPLRRAIEDIRSDLGWITYDEYPRETIGQRFPLAHAFVSLIGDGGFIPAEDFQLGLFLIAPKTLYRDHFHPAPELYVPLTGPHGWRFGTDGSWHDYGAHIPIWNEPMRVHATLVRDEPFLALYAWTRDVDGIAVVKPAPDWAEIEAGL